MSEIPHPHQDEIEYWWLDDGHEPQVVMVRWFRGQIRAAYFGGAIKPIMGIEGSWEGPIQNPWCEVIDA